MGFGAERTRQVVTPTEADELFRRGTLSDVTFVLAGAYRAKGPRIGGGNGRWAAIML